MIGDNNELNQLHQEVEALHTIIAQHTLNDQCVFNKANELSKSKLRLNNVPLTLNMRPPIVVAVSVKSTLCSLSTSMHIVIVLTTIMSLVLMVLEVRPTSYLKWHNLHLITLKSTLS
jgi:hypothetical protein